MNEVWTNRRVRVLKKMWFEGASVADITEALGLDSRDQVVGKAHRLGLPKRPSPIKQTTAVSRSKSFGLSRTPRGAPRSKKSRKALRSSAACPDLPRPKTEAERQEMQEPKGCRWIEGDVTESDWRFCQAPQQPGSSYCPHHHARCHIKKGSTDHVQAEKTMNTCATFVGKKMLTRAVVQEVA